jgi:DNA transformation protein
VDSLQDVFALFGSIRTKRMLGGHGIYRGGLMFALVVDDVLYLKADQQLRSAFAARSLPPFAYQRKGKIVRLSYYLARDEIFDDPAVAKHRADQAYRAALRAGPADRG